MTSACMLFLTICEVAKKLIWKGTYYVNYHGLLTELRSLTRNYPFRYMVASESKSLHHQLIRSSLAVPIALKRLSVGCTRTPTAIGVGTSRGSC